MSWITLLYDTYNNVTSCPNPPADLLPIAHSTQKAHIEVTISGNGDFIGGNLVDEENSVTVIPASESSASRSGKYPFCHPLCDKLQYVAGDYTDYGGTKGDSFYYQYIEELGKWCNSPYANPKAIAIYEYVKKGTLIRDLVGINVLCVDESNKLLKKFNTQKKMSVGGQEDAFVRFIVQNDDTIGKVWQDKQLQNDFIQYYLSTKTETDFCYITGENVYCTNNHSKKIRHSGDGAKIISSNDTSGFTFRGRFLSAKEVANVSYEVSQKAHNALKWLIQKQGKSFGDKVFLLWSTNNDSVPNITENSLNLFSAEDYSDKIDTGEDFAQYFNQAISGYKNTITQYSHLALIGLDSATTGRMSINLFREYLGLQGCNLIDNINKWHTECAWNNKAIVMPKEQEQDNQTKKDKKPKGKVVWFYGAPSPKDIAQAAFGNESDGKFIVNDKLMAKIVERILICIIDGKKIPTDIVMAALHKSFYPMNYSKEYIWEQVLSIACSLYRKYLKDYYKEDWTMDLKNCEDVSYNCGRLLAMAHWLEKCTQSKGDERPTNAMRYFTRFSQQPCDTWRTIINKLQPYIQKLDSSNEKRGLLGYFERQVEEICSQIPVGDFNNEQLDGKMALGYYCQLKECYKPKAEKTETTETI